MPDGLAIERSFLSVQLLSAIIRLKWTQSAPRQLTLKESNGKAKAHRRIIPDITSLLAQKKWKKEKLMERSYLSKMAKSLRCVGYRSEVWCENLTIANATSLRKNCFPCCAKPSIHPVPRFYYLLGKCKALWAKPRTSWYCERLCRSPTGLSCRSFDRDRRRAIEKFKCNRQATLSYDFFVWTPQPTQEFDCRTSSGCRPVFVRYARWQACQDSLSGWTRLALRLSLRKKVNVEEKTWMVKPTIQSFATGTEPECEIEE